MINMKYEGNGKHILENCEYYINQYKNDLQNEKGIEYYSNRNILYKRDFVNDKSERNGKFIYEKNEYYAGQWKNGF